MQNYWINYIINVIYVLPIITHNMMIGNLPRIFDPYSLRISPQMVQGTDQRIVGEDLRNFGLLENSGDPRAM